MRITPYLIYNGQCGEAFRFYQEVLGGKLDIMTHADSPMADQFPDRRDLVMHAHLAVGEMSLMGSDSPPEYFEKPQGIHVSVQVKGVADAERIYRALAQSGKETMPMEKTFWAERFGMLTDRFGIPWMVGTDS